MESFTGKELKNSLIKEIENKLRDIDIPDFDEILYEIQVSIEDVLYEYDIKHNCEYIEK